MCLKFDQNKNNIQVQKSGRYSKILIHWDKHITAPAAVSKLL